MVKNQAGEPVPNARVVFRLPPSGPSGTFAGGQTMEEVATNGKGIAAVWGIKWNATPGSCQIAIIAKSGTATAGTTVAVQVVSSNAPPPTTVNPGPPPTLRAPVAPTAPVSPPEPTPARAAVPVPQAPATGTVAPSVVRRKLGASFEVDLPFRPAPPPPAPEPIAASPAVPMESGFVRKPGVVLTRTVGPLEKTSSSRGKWIWLGLGIAGALGGGAAYKLMNKPGAVAGAVVSAEPHLSIGVPAISVGKP